MIYIKKIFLVLCLCLLVWGCDSKEVTVNTPNGDSLTYNFFKNYNKDKYTLKLRNNNRDITIIHAENKNYYEVKDENETTIIIEKDNVRYNLSSINNIYTEEDISDYTDYVLGYLPYDVKKFKTLEYKTGKEKIGVLSYKYEKYIYDGGTTTYYFRGEKLKYIKKTTPLDENEVEFISISSKVNQNKFDIPNGYQKLEF